MTRTPRLADESEGGRNPAEVLAEEFAERLRRGESPSIQEYVDRRPDLADEILALFPPIAMMERAGPLGTRTGASGRPATFGFELARETVGDFHIVREIGRGGMGVVYEARQLSLNRRVALKILCPSVAGSAQQLVRFRREAEAAARLHHTNIVPVFGTGEDDGLHFYAMQWIDGVSFGDILDAIRGSADGDWPLTATGSSDTGSGDSPSAGFTVPEAVEALLRRTARSRGRLREAPSQSVAGEYYLTRAAAEAPSGRGESDEGDGQDDRPRWPSAKDVLADRPEYWRRVAKIGVSVARALAYSHQQGVLHRDIKPSNVLLDRGGIVWVADFGLAKHEDHRSVTNTGDIVGTIRYMAPEQFNGQADARSDIHSLGLMLYELLTLRPAFGPGRHGAIIRQKMTSPPPRASTIVPQIPRDLETIVRKACAVDPAGRYPRAEAMEADLKRFLEGRPIHARRVLPVERLWRWAGRNPVTAVLSMSTLGLLLTAVVVFAVGTYRTNRALGLLGQEKTRVEREKARVEREKARVEAEKAKAVSAGVRATREHARAEKNVQVAIAAFEQIMANLASRGAVRSFALPEDHVATAVTPADVRLLETLLTFFDRFATDRGADLQAESAGARRRVGDILKQLGRFDEAKESYDKALAGYEALAASGASGETFVVERARIHNEIADAHSRRGQVRQAVQAHLRARALLERSGPDPSSQVRFELARTLVLKVSASVRGGIRASEPTTRPSRPALAGRGPASRRRGRGPGGIDRWLGLRGPGGRRLQRGDLKSLLKSRDCTRALELLDELVDEDPNNPQYALMRARARRAKAYTLLGQGQPDDARTSLQVAIQQLQRLCEQFPDAAVFQYELADTLRVRLTEDEDLGGQIPRAVAISTRLLAQHADIPEYQALAGDCLSRLAATELDAGDLEAADKHYRQAIAYQKAIADRFAAVVLAQWSYAESLSGLADVHARRGQRDEAEPLLDEAIRRLESLRGEGPARLVVHRFLPEFRSQRAALRRR